MKRGLGFSSAAALLSVSSAAFAQFSGGNLAVSVVTANANGAATALRIIELRRSSVTKYPNALDGTPTGRFYDLPLTAAGPNRRLTVSGANVHEGQITLSDDGRFLLVAGYDAPAGTANVSASPAATVNRVAARIDWTQPPPFAINTTTAFGNAFDGGSVFNAASADGANFFLAGNGGTRGAIAAAAFGAMTATLNYGGTGVKTARNVRYYNGGLYVSGGSASGSLHGVGQVTAGQTDLLSGFEADPTLDTSDFYWLDNETLYVTDERTDGNGGIQQWVNYGGGWETGFPYDHIPAVNGTGYVGIRAVAGSVFFDINEYQFESVLYAITTDNRLVFLQDDDGRGEIITLATAAPGQEFRGVALIQPKTISVGGKITVDGSLNVGVPIHIEFRPTNGGGYFTRTVPTAPDGAYRVDDVPAGTGYQIHVKADNTLAANINVNTFSISALNTNLMLEPGDCNDDNFVDPTDFGIFVSAYNSSTNVPGSGYDARADFNFDGLIDPTDFGLFVGNYNTQGDQ